MPVQIDTTAENNGLRLVNQGAHPPAPSVNHTLLYIMTGTNSGLFIETDQGEKIGPFITGTAVPSSVRILIEEKTPSGTGSVSFLALPGTYKKLTLEVVVRSTQATDQVDLQMQFNGDNTAGNYIYGQWRINGTGTSRDAGSSFVICSTAIPGANTAANHYTTCVINIPQYANTGFYKNALVQAGGFTNGNNQVSSEGMMEWLNTAAITSLTILLSAGDFVSGSVLRLYGEP